MNDLNLMPHEAERNPIVFVKDGDVFANSREVASYFGKEHRDVLRAIDNLLKTEPALGLRNFAQGVYTLPETRAQEHRCFDMDQDGFALLAMGFTGQKALRWKLKYIEAFNTMRSTLTAPPVIDYSDPKLLLGVVGHLQSLVGEKDKVIEAQGERLQALDRLEGSFGSLCLTDAAKTLKKHPQELIRFMQGREWIYKRAGNAAWIGRQRFIGSGLLEHREYSYNDKDGVPRVSTRVLVTGKGLSKLSELLGEAVH